MSAPTCGDAVYRLCDFYEQKGQRSHLPYLTRQMLIRYCIAPRGIHSIAFMYTGRSA